MQRLIPEAIEELSYLISTKYEVLIDYYKKVGDLSTIKAKDMYVFRNKEVRIGVLIATLRLQYKNKTLDKDTIEVLEGLGMKWAVNKVLGDTWEPLRLYYKQYGTLKGVHTDTEFEYNGQVFQVGFLISKLRSYYNKGTLSKSQYIEFKNMGMEWEGRHFDTRLAVLKAYYEKYGTINISTKQVFEYNNKQVRIGLIIQDLRKAYKEKRLLQTEIEILESMDMAWEYNCFDVIKDYYAKYGSLYYVKCNLLHIYKGREYNVGQILYRLRSLYNEGKLTDKEIELLKSMDMRWEDLDYLKPLKAYYRQYGSISNIKHNTTFEYKGKTFAIATKVIDLRVRYKKGELTEEEVRELTKMGMDWQGNTCFKDRLNVLRDYYAKYGTIATIKTPTIYEYDGVSVQVGILINNLRSDYKNGELSQEQIEELENMGMVWQVVKRNPAMTFETKVNILANYMEENNVTLGDILLNEVYIVEDNNYYVGRWVKEFRDAYKGKHNREPLTDRQIQVLESMGIFWDVSFRQGFQKGKKAEQELNK